jgi:hypothetical protein
MNMAKGERYEQAGKPDRDPASNVLRWVHLVETALVEQGRAFGHVYEARALDASADVVHEHLDAAQAALRCAQIDLEELLDDARRAAERRTAVPSVAPAAAGKAAAIAEPVTSGARVALRDPKVRAWISHHLALAGELLFEAANLADLPATPPGNLHDAYALTVLLKINRLREGLARLHDWDAIECDERAFPTNGGAR